ncbi:MAG TPA: hypothetical protein VL172_18790, partial [Kofleriaceae bacterium]|nr:hypothetical protein [Kofleriaceae bacterium]
VFVRTDLFDDFCVYQSTLPMPDYQAGEPPFDDPPSGAWVFDGGAPVYQRAEQARIVITLPRAPLPADGYPVVVFVRTGGGGDRPQVDRGQHDADGNTLEPGEGPARYFARAGYAAIEVDGPHGGLRNVTGGDEQFLIFNVQNLYALRDNVRESAMELALMAEVAGTLGVDASDCPPAGTGDPGPAAVVFDGNHTALMGHSMGATIGPLAVAVQPGFGALILDGAGGSWIENIMYKQKPIALHGLFERLLGHPIGGLRGDDPVLTLAQWALESADPPAYARTLLGQPAASGDPRRILMHQGIVDDYILPRIANATSLSLQLDLAGEELDTIDDPRLADQLPLGPLLPLSGRSAVALPAAGNLVIQHLEDGVEDGHEVTFQTDDPKHQYQCWLASWLSDGTPTAPAGADRDAPCP